MHHPRNASSWSRRDLVKVTLAGTAVTLVPHRAFAQAAGEAPHFFLNLCVSGGMDATYTFDARALALTDAGKQQNYLYKNANPTTPVLTGDDVTPRLHEGVNGGKLLRTKLTDGFILRHGKDVTVLNGVMMHSGLEGHGNNMYFLFTNNGTGGRPSFLPSIGKRLGGALESIHFGGWEGDGNDAPSNFALSLRLLPGQGSGLADTLKNGPVLPPTSPLYQHLLKRLDANAGGAGSFSQGSRKMKDGLGRVEGLSKSLQGAATPAPAEPGAADPAVIATLLQSLEYFRSGVTRAATIIYDNDPKIDVHGSFAAQTQPQLYGDIMATFDEVFTTLKAMPYDEAAGLSFLDVTTVLVSTEFSRTMRQEGSPIDATGTDHNPLTNTLLLAGKGIKGGQVIGASDLTAVDETGTLLDVSGAHLLKDPGLKKAMARPFDHVTGQPRADLPAQHRDEDYLSSRNVINSLLALFKVPEQDFFRYASGIQAPVVPGLTTSV